MSAEAAMSSSLEAAVDGASTYMGVIDSAHTGYVMVCFALVQIMTPGLAFFYSGLLKEGSVVTMMMQNFLTMGIVTIVWFVVGFSLCFGSTLGFFGNPASYPLYFNVGGSPLMLDGEVVVDGIPGLVFAGYQGMFAVITPALMTGAFVHRMNVHAYLIFVTLWLILVYCPFCHWVWGGGWMAQWGVKDFAGGIVVHITAGFSALASVIFLGPRQKDDQETTQPHNLMHVALGTSLLWFGWFGFNGGSALASGATASYAAINSEIAASTCLFTWTLIHWARTGKTSLVELCVGAIAGLATITPLAGYVEPWAAFIIGLLAAFFCYGCVQLREKMGWDDSLDVWGVHGMGGFLGTLLLGIFTSEAVCGTGPSWMLFGKQLAAACITAVYAFVVGYLLLKAMSLVMEVKPQHDKADDVSLHGEHAYLSPTIQKRGSITLETLPLQTAAV